MTDSNGTPNTEPNLTPKTEPNLTPDTTATAAPTTPTAATTPLPTPPAATTTPEPAAAAAPKRRRPLFPTILWGAMMLALAAFIAARELVPGGFDLTTWLLTAVVGIGLLLIVAGIAAASRRAG